MSLFGDLLEKPSTLSTASKYSVLNGYLYLALGAMFVLWPGSVQTIFMDAPFTGHESALFRVTGMAVAVIGWFYVFGGRSGARQIGPASVLDRSFHWYSYRLSCLVSFLIRWARLRF